MTKCSKEGGNSVSYMSDLGQSTVTERVLWALVGEGKLESLVKVRVPKAKMVPGAKMMSAFGFSAWSSSHGCFGCTGWSWCS